MDFSALYYMDDAMMHGAFRSEPETLIDAIAIGRAEIDPPKPFVFQYASGGRPRDLIGTGYVSVILLADRIFEILDEHAWTGWTSFPVEIHGRQSERIDGYHGFAVTGRCGPVLWEKGKKIRKPKPVPGGQAYDAWLGMFFDPETWDGSDIFMPEATTYPIVIEPIMQALTQAKVKNIKFKPLTEFERSWPL